MRRASIIIIALAAALAAARADDSQPLLRAGPLVMYAGPDSARIWVAPIATLDAPLTLVVSKKGSSSAVHLPIALAKGRRSATVQVKDLEPRTTYLYEVRVGGRVTAETAGSFRTAPEPGKPVKGRIAVVSCMNVERYPHQYAWEPLLDEDPDLIAHLGDNVYSNTTDKEELWRWHLAQRNVPEYAKAIRTTACLAIWDDHDFGENDSDGTQPGKEKSLELFEEIWPNPAAGLDDEPGVFFSTSYGDVDLFFTDGRYDRSPDMQPASPRKKMLGEKQWEWLERGLAESRATFKLVFSGSTIDVAPKDCWAIYPQERARLLGLTKKVPGIVFVTGDVHTSLIARSEPPEAAYPFYEIVSSGIAVNPVPAHSFVSIEVDTNASDPVLVPRVHYVDGKGKVRKQNERRIHLSELGWKY